jgi:protein-S-isoprenylcysteine O-methyltransferase Ste14
MFKKAYWAFSFLGLMTVWASFILGFRWAPDAAPANNVWFNVLIYGAFIAVHIVMTMPAFKNAVYGPRAGTPLERRVYIAITVVTWLLVYAFHRPVAGPGWVSPPWLHYLGLCGYLLAIAGFFEFATFEGLGSLVGVPDAALSHSVGSETPLMTEGPYASVRHPMYRAAFYANLCSLVMWPNAAQLLWSVMVAVSFFGFIPFEERQLLRARGDEYRAYMARTPYRVFHGIW